MAEAVPVVAELSAEKSGKVPGPKPHQVRSVGPDVVVDGPVSFVETWFRLLLGLAWFGVCTVAFVFVLFLFLPSRPMRIRKPRNCPTRHSSRSFRVPRSCRSSRRRTATESWPLKRS